MAVKDMDISVGSGEPMTHGPEISARDARQGRQSLRIVWVLTISLALAALATFGVWISQSGRLAGPGGQTAITAPGYSHLAPAARQKAQDPVPPASPPGAERNVSPQG